jgi:regulator of replication initiation timing
MFNSKKILDMLADLSVEVGKQRGEINDLKSLLGHMNRTIVPRLESEVEGIKTAVTEVGDSIDKIKHRRNKFEDLFNLYWDEDEKKHCYAEGNVFGGVKSKIYLEPGGLYLKDLMGLTEEITKLKDEVEDIKDSLPDEDGLYDDISGLESMLDEVEEDVEELKEELESVTEEVDALRVKNSKKAK